MSSKREAGCPAGQFRAPSYFITCMKKALKEDTRYASRWMIFLEPLGLGALLVCGEAISRLVWVRSGIARFYC
jgi:hypothetical protein